MTCNIEENDKKLKYPIKTKEMWFFSAKALEIVCSFTAFFIVHLFY